MQTKQIDKIAQEIIKGDNMKTPKISVIMPAYNSEQYIAEAIESILNQTFSDFEFIIINDGSTDKTADIVRSYDDSRIRFIDNSVNQGISTTANLGLELANGEYIARMDSDDISHSNRFEKQVTYMDAHPECGVLSASYHMFGDADRITVHPEYVGSLDLLVGCYVAHPVTMIRKSVIDEYNFVYDKDFVCAEDYDLWARMARVTEIHNLQDVLLEYRWHETNISNIHAEIQAENVKRIRQKILDYLTHDKNIQHKVHDVIFKKPIKKIKLFGLTIAKIES